MRSIPEFNTDLLIELMDKEGLDLILVSSKHNVMYITGGYFYPLFVWDTHTRETQYLPFIVIPGSEIESSFFVGRPGEREVSAESDIWLDDCVESPKLNSISASEQTAREIKSRGLNTGRIGLEMTAIPADAYLALKKEFPQAEFIDITGMMDTLRAVKSEKEIEVIRQGTLLNLKGVNESLASAMPGMTTLDLADMVKKKFSESNIHFLYALVCAGPDMFRAASPKRTFKAGHILHIDTGAMLSNGCIAETCRTGHIGNPTAEAEKLLGLCNMLEYHMLDHLVPGASVSDVQKEADSFIERTSPGLDGKFIAHGIGMVHHEKPVVSRNSSERLLEGMVLSLEMEYKTRDTGHVKIEDMVVIRKDRPEILSPDGGEWVIGGAAG